MWATHSELSEQTDSRHVFCLQRSSGNYKIITIQKIYSVSRTKANKAKKENGVS